MHSNPNRTLADVEANIAAVVAAPAQQLREEPTPMVTPNPPATPGEVTVLVINHQSGVNVSAHATYELAREELLDFVETFWEAECIEAELTGDSDTDIDAYFDPEHGVGFRESYELVTTPVNKG